MTPAQDEYLTIEEVAQLTRTSVPTLHTWRREKRGPVSIRIGRRVLYPASKLHAFMAAQVAAQEAARRVG